MRFYNSLLQNNFLKKIAEDPESPLDETTELLLKKIIEIELPNAFKADRYIPIHGRSLVSQII